MTRRKASTPPAEQLRVPGVAFLLSQLGYHSSRRWKARLAPLGLDPRQVMVLRRLAADEGRSHEHEQQLCRGLQPAERGQLITLLNRLAAEQGLAEGVHPGAANPDPDER
jgi:hypothetical protein